MVRKAIVVLAAMGLASVGGAKTLWIEAKRVVTQCEAPIENGRIVVKDGRIEAVGKDLPRPPFSERVDAREQVVTPGFVLPLTEMGMPSAPAGPQQEGVRVEMKPDAKASDELVPRRAEHAVMLDAGITAAGLLPIGDDPGIPGQVSVISTRARGPEAVLLAESSLVVSVATHAQWRKAVGEAFRKAVDDSEEQQRRAKKSKTAKDAGKPADPKGAVAAAVARKRPTIVLGAGMASWTAARDALPFDHLDAWILDGPDLWTEAASVKAAGAKILTYPVLSRERDTRVPVNRAAKWSAAGVPFAFVLTSDDPEGAVRLRDHLMEMVRAGLSREEALAAVTSRAAEALGMADQVGSIQQGRRADLLFWSGDPLAPLSKLESVMVSGETVDRLAKASLPGGAAP